MAAETVLDLTRKLLEAIRTADWGTYQEHSDPSLTCFEPETHGQLVEGLDFHRFYFERGGHMGRHGDTVVSPHVRMLGDDAAIVCYTRLVQHEAEDGRLTTASFQETRVWRKGPEGWRHVHFHRSREPKS